MVSNDGGVLLCVSNGFLCLPLCLCYAFLLNLARPLLQQLCTLLTLVLLLCAGGLWEQVSQGTQVWHTGHRRKCDWGRPTVCCCSLILWPSKQGRE